MRSWCGSCWHCQTLYLICGMQMASLPCTGQHRKVGGRASVAASQDYAMLATLLKPLLSLSALAHDYAYSIRRSSRVWHIMPGIPCLLIHSKAQMWTNLPYECIYIGHTQEDRAIIVAMTLCFFKCCPSCQLQGQWQWWSSCSRQDARWMRQRTMPGLLCMRLRPTATSVL